jgi:hypothetical protein
VTVGILDAAKEVSWMPSKIAAERPFSLFRLIGWWAVSIVLAYAVGWSHITWSTINAPQHPASVTAPAQH